MRNKQMGSSVLVGRYNNRLVVGLVVVSALLLLIWVVSSASFNYTHATSSNVNFNVSIAPTLMVSLSADNITLNVTPTANGNFAASNNLTVSVSSNTTNGYKLTMGTTSTALIRNGTMPDNTTPTIPTLSSTSTTYTQSNFETNSWGYQMDDGGYKAIKAEDTLKEVDSIGTTTTTMNFATKLDDTLPSGTYATTLNFVATANPVSYSLTYNKGNTTDSVTLPSPNPQTGVVEYSSSVAINLSSTVPARTGYTFLGWCATMPTTLNGADSCNGGSGTVYSAGGVYTMDTTAATTATLYAMWELPTMQTFTRVMCQDQASSAPVTVIDARDGNDYTVRWIYGDCWMTQNLRFTGTNLDPSTTNVTSAKTMTYYDLKENGGEGQACYGNSSGEGNGYNNACIHIPDATDLSNNGGLTAEQVGAWYNYAAATAGNITGTNNSTNSSVNFDICPAGWRLPTRNEQSGITSQETSYSPVLGGFYINASLASPSLVSYSWSATAAYTGSGPYYRSVLIHTSTGTSRLDANAAANTSSGCYIRCIRKS